MARRGYESLYYADDKDIADFLEANRQQLTGRRLASFVREMGILCPSATPRERVAALLARIPFSWVELDRLGEMTQLADRPERTTYEELRNTVDLATVFSAATELSRPMSESGDDEIVHVDRKKSGAVEVRVQYPAFDRTRSRLLQRTQREVTIKFEHASGGVRIRYPANAKSEEIVERILSRMPNPPTSDARFRLSLAGMTSPKDRTRFFLELVQGLEGYEVENISRVKALPADAIQEPDDIEDEEPDLIEPEKAAFVAKVKEVALRGTLLDQSSQLKALLDSNFFIAGVSWVARQATASGLRVALEAKFSNGSRGEGFEHKLTKVHERMDGGQFKKTGRAPTEDEKEGIARVVEDSAVSLVNKISSEFGDALVGLTGADAGGPKDAS